MKKVLALLAGAGAVAGAVWLLNKKKKQWEQENEVIFTEEFDEQPETAELEETSIEEDAQ